MERRLLIAAGGTGGHMFPARAAAEALIERGWQVKLVTDARGAKHARGFPGEAISEISASSPFVKNPVKLAGALGRLARGLGQTRAIIRQFRPDVVAGFGGYPAFPALAAARLASIPYVIHEQNAVLGRVNRVFAGGAFAVASGFERLDRLPAKARHEVTGNPVRAAIREAREAVYEAPGETGPIRLLVIGGSLGARILSDTVPAAIARLPGALRARLDIAQQVRAESLDQVRAAYAKAGVTAQCEAFFEDMGRQYARAHLVLARAGASSVAEIAAVGRPAIFVPLAIAMDDHQAANAESLVEAGAADCLRESAFTAEALSARLESLLTDREALALRAGRARALGKPDAHARLADLIESAARD